MNKAVVYIHGKGGNVEEAEIYRSIFNGYDVIGFDYASENPWDAKVEFQEYFRMLKEKYESITVIANSIGAYFFMVSGIDADRHFFISPIVDMEKLIEDMLVWAGVTEDELKEKNKIETDFNEVLSYEYLTWVRENSLIWNHKADIIYGEHDSMQSFYDVNRFANRTGSSLTIMNGGEHWFHTDEQTEFLLTWMEYHIENRQYE